MTEFLGDANPNILLQSDEYEVLRVEGVESGEEIKVDPEISFNKESIKLGKRRHLNGDVDGNEPYSPTKIKRLRLIMGKETMSTVNYS